MIWVLVFALFLCCIALTVSVVCLVRRLSYFRIWLEQLQDDFLFFKSDFDGLSDFCLKQLNRHE